MTVCYGFVCRRREILNFTPGDRTALTQILAAGHASAAAERAAVQKAVIWFDRRMGPVIGTNKRVANADFRDFDDKHNYDCWDTTRNTTSLLLVLQEWGLFKFHAVGDPHYRGNALVLQLPHNTAVLVERATKVEWVVDMWPRGYAQPPDVMTARKMGQGRLTVKRRLRSRMSIRAKSNARKSSCPLLPNALSFLRCSWKPHSRITSESALLPTALSR